MIEITDGVAREYVWKDGGWILKSDSPWNEPGEVRTMTTRWTTESIALTPRERLMLIEALGTLAGSWAEEYPHTSNDVRRWKLLMDKLHEPQSGDVAGLLTSCPRPSPPSL